MVREIIVYMFNLGKYLTCRMIYTMNRMYGLFISYFEIVVDF